MYVVFKFNKKSPLYNKNVIYLDLQNNFVIINENGKLTKEVLDPVKALHNLF